MSDAERRQLTVLFCDLVDSTPLSRALDPEDLREVMRAYYDTCGKVIERFDGHIAQYLGDGLLVFFGYPRAHEDDAQRAVRAGLGMVEAVEALNAVIRGRHGVELAVRLGCHTGLVVVGEVVGEGRHELMALGDTPNIAARLQGVAEPNSLVIGPLTYQLVGGFFNCRSLGTPPLKGVVTPLEVYRVVDESSARTRLEAVGATGLTPLVGRDAEVRQLEECWAAAANGRGRVVLVTGEAGIGKSRLVHALTEHAVDEQAWLTPCQASPYHQDTAFYPFIDLFERVVLRFERPESPGDKLRKLETFFIQSGLPLEDDLPHLCSLLSIPPADGQEFPFLPPDQQKQQTMLALHSILRRRAATQPVLFVVEDLHWIDPTTVEFLTQLTEQIDQARILAVFTCRPEFRSPWTGNPNVTEIDLTRLAPTEATELIRRVAGGKTLPDEIAADMVTKTDGVPLFIEELTKTVLESGSARGEAIAPLRTRRRSRRLAIPNTLHDSLMARLDRLSAIKEVGATRRGDRSRVLLFPAGRRSPPCDEAAPAGAARASSSPPSSSPRRRTRSGRDVPLQARAHSDAAYQSLLRSKRQQHHEQIATTLWKPSFPRDRRNPT